ncbi:hypothetical protein OC844_007418 [Tilletia horrida]|nr:hypothetical protein OC844_007418 [Tilletia horrida]
MNTLFHPIPSLYDTAFVLHEQGDPVQQYNQWIMEHAPPDVDPVAGLGWVWVLRERGEQHELDNAGRVAVLHHRADCEAMLFAAGQEIAQIPDHENHPEQIAAIMNPVMAAIQQLAAENVGLREGEWLFFLGDDEDPDEFVQFFIDLAESLRAGPLQLLNGQGDLPVVTAVKISGMLYPHPEHDNACIAVLFEDCWNQDHAREVFQALQHHHPAFAPIGVKCRLYSSLGIYDDNVWNVPICHFFPHDMD